MAAREKAKHLDGRLAFKCVPRKKQSQITSFEMTKAIVKGGTGPI